MTAVRLTLWSPDDDRPAPSPAWEAANQAIAQQFTPRHVPPHQRASYANATDWWQFTVVDCGGRWEPLPRTRAAATLQKERQALRRFIEYSRPEGWTGEWPGPSLAAMDGRHESYLDSVYARMLSSGLAPATVMSTRSHLSAVFRHAVRIGAIEAAPRSSAIAPDPDQRPRIYTPAEVVAIRTELSGEPDLQAAFWVAVHLGPRPSDLFRWRWDKIERDLLGRPLMGWLSEKTKRYRKQMLVPLPARVWSVLERLPRSSPFLFPRLGSPLSRSPEKTAQARARNAMLKRAIERAGVTLGADADADDEIDRPWQVARATANERLETYAPGVGQFVLGHSLRGVNARSYREPTAAVWAALESLPEFA